jgi:hypothetical protein
MKINLELDITSREILEAVLIRIREDTGSKQL